MSRKDRLSSAIDTLAGKLENGHLLAASDSAEFLTAAASEIDRLTRELAEAKSRAVIPAGWVAVPVDVLDRFPEINPSNYDHDDACALNAWAAELVLSTRPESPPYGLPKKQLVPSAADLLDEFEARTKALPCQHEVPERGCSSYNWQMAMIREMRAWIARPDAPKLEDSDYE